MSFPLNILTLYLVYNVSVKVTSFAYNLEFTNAIMFAFLVSFVPTSFVINTLVEILFRRAYPLTEAHFHPNKDLWGPKPFILH